MKICTSCDRYVRSEEQACPFCEGTQLMEERIVNAGERRGSRAGVYAARVAITGAALGAAVACGQDDRDDEKGPTASGGVSASSGGDAASGGDSASGGRVAMVTGGRDGLDPTSGDGDGFPARGDGGDSADILIYGGPFPDMMKARV